MLRRVNTGLAPRPARDRPCRGRPRRHARSDEKKGPV